MLIIRAKVVNLNEYHPLLLYNRDRWIFCNLSLLLED